MGKKQSDELVYAEAGFISVIIKGPASHPTAPGVTYTDSDATLRVRCDATCKLRILTEEQDPLHQAGRYWSCQYAMQPMFYEQQDYEIIILSKAPDHKVEFWHENPSIRKSVTEINGSESVRLLTGVVNFKNDIGLSDLVIRVDGQDYLRLTIEVFPSKISYKEDYQAIVADVTAEIYNLVFDFLKRTYYSFDIADDRPSTPVEFMAIIRKIYKEFMSAANMVIERPHHALESEHLVLPAHKIRRTDNRTIRWIEQHPEHTRRKDGRLQVDRALAVVRHVTYDTPENRLTKYMLQSTVRRLQDFRRQYARSADGTNDPMTVGIDEMIRNIRRLYTTGFMREVSDTSASSSMSLVFTMAPGYRELYRYYLMLRHGLSITGSIYDTSVKDLAELYEYWCFIKLNSLLRKKYHLVKEGVIQSTGSGLSVRLVKGKRSKVKYINLATGEEIVLSYNPKYVRAGEEALEEMPEGKYLEGSATVTQKPDNVLTLVKNGSNSRYQYIFDAKYRIDMAGMDGDGRESMYRKKYHTPGPQEGDINTMHRYRDAIVYRSGALPYERAMFGAYVLFPYRNEDEYRNHALYKSIDQVNVGGLPFLPSATSMVEEMLDQLIDEQPAAAFARAPLPRGNEEYLERVGLDDPEQVGSSLMPEDSAEHKSGEFVNRSTDPGIMASKYATGVGGRYETGAIAADNEEATRSEVS